MKHPHTYRSFFKRALKPYVFKSFASSGINEPENNLRMLVYPVPTDGLITISEAATVTYVLEVEADIPLNIPGPTTTNLGAGTSQVSYTLELTDSANGSVTLHVTSPEDVRSETIGFTLTCQ